MPRRALKDMNNTGVTQCKIMKEMFGSNCNYSELFRES